MPVGLISHVRRFFSRYPPERCSPDLSTFSPATSTSGFIIDAVLVPLHVGRVGLAHGESPVKNPNTRAHARMSQKEAVFFLNTPSTLNLKYSHPRFSEPPPPLYLCGPERTAWTCFRCALPAVTRLRCWANAAATHAPPLLSARCLWAHTLRRTHTHKHTHVPTPSSTHAHAHIRVWTAKWMSSQQHPELWKRVSMLLDGQMCKCNRVTHFNGYGGERGRVRACVRAAG